MPVRITPTYFAPLAILLLLPSAAQATEEDLAKAATRFAHHRVVCPFERLEMPLNSSCVLITDQYVEEADASDGEALDAVPITPSQIVITAKRCGTIRFVIVDANRKTFTLAITVPSAEVVSPQTNTCCDCGRCKRCVCRPRCWRRRSAGR